MKASFETIQLGLDQLWFSPLAENESASDRDEAIKNFLSSNHWDWNSYLNELGRTN